MPERIDPTPTADHPRKRRAGVRLIAVVALMVIVGGAVAVYAVTFGGRTAADSAGTTELHRVARTSFDISVTANGELEAKRQTEIRSQLETPAAIVQVVDEGVHVAKGDVLVKLSSESIETQMQDQQLVVESARSELTAAENDYQIQLNENDAALRQAKLKVELAEIALKKWQEGDDKKERTVLDMAIDSAERELAICRDKAVQTHQLYEKGFASKEDLQNDDKRLAEAEAAMKTARLDKVVYEEYEVQSQMKKLSSDVDEAKAELERVIKKNDSQITIKDADRTNKRRQLQLREEKLAKLQTQLKNTTITAPTDGLVVYATSVGRGRGFMMMGGDGPIQIGRNIQPNELIMVLPETGQMVASVRVHESIAGSIKPGQKATIRIEAVGNQSFAGTVDSVGVLAETDGWRDPNLREYTVKVALDAANAQQRLKPSMRCETEIILGTVDNALAVPVQAVFRDGAMAFVYVPAGGKYERVPVRLGRRSSVMAQVRDPSPDELAQYAAAGVRTVKEGDLVLLREPTPGEVVDAKFSDKALALFAPRQGPGGMGGPAGGRQMVQQAGERANGPGPKVAAADPKKPGADGAAGDAPASEGEKPAEAPADGAQTIRLDGAQAAELLKKAGGKPGEKGEFIIKKDGAGDAAKAAPKPTE